MYIFLNTHIYPYREYSSHHIMSHFLLSFFVFYFYFGILLLHSDSHKIKKKVSTKEHLI